MRIAIDGRVITDRFPGIGRYTWELVRALAAVADTERLIVLCNPHQRAASYDMAELEKLSAVRLVAVRAPVRHIASQWEVPQAIAAVGADVYHATYWLMPYRPGVPTVLSLYDLIGVLVPGAVPRFTRLVLRLALFMARSAADHIITLSDWSRRDLVLHAGELPERVSVTHLAAGPSFRPASDEQIAELRARLHLPDPYVLYVGTNKPHKNLSTLVRAWELIAADLSGREPPATAGPPQLVVAGRWDARYEEPQRLVDALGLAPFVHFIGPVPDPDLPVLYSGAAAFAYPSRYEGFGLPPLEAMACGVPVVASSATSLPEVLQGAALLVPPDDVHAWATTIGQVLGEPALSEQLRAQSLKRAQCFSWEDTARRTLSVYRKVASRYSTRER